MKEIPPLPCCWAQEHYFFQPSMALQVKPIQHGEVGLTPFNLSPPSLCSASRINREEK